MADVKSISIALGVTLPLNIPKISLNLIHLTQSFCTQNNRPNLKYPIDPLSNGNTIALRVLCYLIPQIPRKMTKQT